MNRNSEAKKFFNPNKTIDRFIAIYEILRIVTDIDGYLNWLKNHHEENNYKAVIQGYKFLILTILRTIIGIIETDVFFKLKEDEVFKRALFNAIPLYDIPTTNEKIKIIKNIWMISKHLRKANSWEELKDSIRKLFKGLDFLDKIYRISETINCMRKSHASRILSIFYTWFYLMDVNDYRIPKGYIKSKLLFNIKDINLENVFEGYKLIILYLLKKLIKQEELFKNLTREIKQAKKWEDLHKAYKLLKTKIINLDLLQKNLFTIKNPSKKIFSNLLFSSEITEPSFLKSRKNKIEIRKWLDYKLLWYPIEVLNSSPYILFSGVPAFISLLLGLVNIHSEKIKVKIFKHPVNLGYNYSFGILIPMYGSSGISDYSGWLIFFNCATDYSGFGGGLLRIAKDYIEILDNEDKIEIEEIIIDLQHFINYLKDSSSSSVFSRIIIYHPLLGQIYYDKNHIEKYIDQVRGFIFEMIVYKWVSNSEEMKKVYHNLLIEGEEIDVLSIGENDIKLFECTVTTHKDNIDNKINSIKRKVNVISKNYPNKNIRPILAVLFEIPDEHKKVFEKNGIEVIDNFKEKIKKLFTKDKINILMNLLLLYNTI